VLKLIALIVLLKISHNSWMPELIRCCAQWRSKGEQWALGPGRHLLEGGTLLINIKFQREFEISNSSSLLLNEVLNGLTLQKP